MENREAIRYINAYIAVNKELDEKEKEAFNRAFSALEFKENYDQFWEEVKAAGTKGKETEIHHSGRVFRIREVAQ